MPRAASRLKGLDSGRDTTGPSVDSARGSCLCRPCLRRRASRRLWKARQIARGKCRYCKRKRVNALYCEKHNAMYNVARQRWRSRR